MPCFSVRVKSGGVRHNHREQFLDVSDAYGREAAAWFDPGKRCARSSTDDSQTGALPRARTSRLTQGWQQVRLLLN